MTKTAKIFNLSEPEQESELEREPEREPESEQEPEPVKRLNVNLPASRLEDLQRLARRRGTSMTDLVRWALGLVEKAVEEAEEGNTIAVINPQGKVIKELVLPL